MSRILFDSFDSQGLSFTLAVTEAPDTVALEAETIISTQLNSTDIIDAANITAQNIASLILSADDIQDTVLIDIDCHSEFLLSAIEGPDSGNITAQNIIDLELSATENHDTALININSYAERNATLDVTEAQDTANIKVIHRIIEQSRTYIPLSRVPWAPAKIPDLNISFLIQENKDSIKIKVATEEKINILARENRDYSSVKILNVSDSVFLVNENKDKIENDVEAFRAWIDEKTGNMKNMRCKYYYRLHK